MRVSSLLKPALIIAAVGLVWGCQKESVNSLPLANASTDAAMLSKKPEKLRHPLRAEYMARWDTVNVNPEGIAAYGAGEGHSNLLGNSHLLYNTYSPYAMPLIFTSLSVSVIPSLATTLHLYGYNPEDLSKVSVITFDDKGNSIWSQVKVGTVGTYTPGDPIGHFVLPVKVTGYYTIIGGTGRFAGAEGSYTLTGYWMPQEPHETGLTISEGEIYY